MFGLFRTKPVSGQPTNPTFPFNESVSNAPFRTTSNFQATMAKDPVTSTQSGKAVDGKAAGTLQPRKLKKT